MTSVKAITGTAAAATSGSIFGPARRSATVSDGRRLTARIGLRLDRESDCDREGTGLGRRRDAAAELDPAKRVADTDGNAELAPELRVDAAELGAAAGEEHLADVQRVGTRLVELQRGQQLAREDLQLLRERRARRRDLHWREVGSGRVVRERELVLDGLGFFDGNAEREGERRVE